MLDSISRLAKKVFGDANTREIKRLQPNLQRINALESTYEQLDHAAILAKTAELKQRIANGASVDDVLPEAFAAVREGAKRVTGMRHYDCQMIGGMVLHSGKIAEMKTGEGKTLVATLAVYTNALAGKGVHVVTVNDYLAQRDADWMGQIYKYLGMSTGVILSNERNDQVKRAAYAADITYGTNNEFGFDYLRDNMKFSLDQYVQRGHFYGIVDEVDSILIDEARTPLIISGPAEASVELYAIVDAMIPLLQVETDFVIDEKNKNVTLTDEGMNKVESRLGIDNLYDMQSQEILHHVMQSLKAHHVFKRDKDYVVRDGKVVIVDEFTGRLMQGRRWSDGLHQAVEAKEKVRVEPESQVYATITFQNYFRMYSKLAGMTGTADTEAPEFASIYKLDTIVIPTNRPVDRKDFDDVVYKTRMEKLRSVMRDIQDCHVRGQPVLVGTTSVEKSEILAELLRRANIAHEVLNAKNHLREAHIVAQAGRKGACTISTNMAGRGTDIRLGGNPEEMAKEFIDPVTQPAEYAAAVEKFKVQCAAEAEVVKAAGGLHIIGTERHESRRIDNQLRGRSGRQGDPGSSRFYLSLEDDLLRLFGSDKITIWMERMGLKDDEPIEHKWISSAIENAQKKVEGHHFQMRKNLLEYDDVMNYQRKGVYDLRKRALAGEGMAEMVDEALENVISDIMDECAEEGVSPEQWPIADMRSRLSAVFGLNWEDTDAQIRDHSRFELRDRMLSEARAKVAAQSEALTPEKFLQYSRIRLLALTDSLWKDHLLAIDRLRQGVGLRGYGQRNPVLEYKREAFHMFLLMSALRDESLLQELCQATQEQVDMMVGVSPTRARQMVRQQTPVLDGSAGGTPLLTGPGFMPLPKSAPLPQSFAPAAPPAAAPQSATAASRPAPGDEARAYALAMGIRRNDPCPCGSGNKFKKCCGANVADAPESPTP
jgi:preprotein translocase subunit SecA